MSKLEIQEEDLVYIRTSPIRGNIVCFCKCDIFILINPFYGIQHGGTGGVFMCCRCGLVLDIYKHEVQCEKIPNEIESKIATIKWLIDYDKFFHKTLHFKEEETRLIYKKYCKPLGFIRLMLNSLANRFGCY